MLGLGLTIPEVAVRGGGYNPLAALGADLQGWFDATRPDSMTIAATLVAEMRCLKTGYAITQGTGGAQPVYSATSFGGDPGLSFDGVDDVLSGVSHPYPLVDFEAWLLLSQTAAPGDTTQRYALGMGAGSANGATVSRVVNGGVNRIRGTVGNGTSGLISNNVTVDFSSRHVARMIVKTSGVTMEIDGTTVAETAAAPSLTNARFRIGAFINTLPGNFHSGLVAGCLITSLLSGSRRTDLESWLLARRRL